MVTSCAAAWGDYDGDGDLDLVISGYIPSGVTSDAYKCTGGVFSSDGTSSTNLVGAYLVDLAFGDYDNDGDVDLALSGQGGGTKLYASNGSVLSEVASAFPMGVGESAVAWGDFDLDGDLDLAYSGTSTGLYSDIFRNTAGSFTYASPPLTDVSWGDLDWGDYDRDSTIDLLLAGESSGGNVTEVYGNSGGTLALDASVALVGVGIYRSAAAWGDFDNDGWLDVALAGATTLSSPYSPTCKIYRNVAGTFTDISAPLSGVWACSLDWGDYDNDGDLDLVVSGRQGSSWITRIYRNDAGTFVYTQAEVVGVGRSSVAWGDYDDDGDLDLVIVGSTSESVHVARIYRNDVATANTPPTAPANLSTDPPAGGEVTFKWDSSSDGAQTPADGLSYNLRVGTSDGGSEVCSGMADTNGRRLIPARGPIQPGQSGNSVTLTLPGGQTYYWSVQAIDTGFEGSPWGTQATVTTP